MKRMLLFLLLIPVLTYGQTKFCRSQSDLIPERFKISQEELRDYILADMPEGYKEGRYPRSTFRYADEAALKATELLLSGKIYSDWPELENYVNEILQKVVPNDLKDAPYLHVYLVKDGSFNTFSSPSGMIFMSVGVVANARDESTLAGTIAREVELFQSKYQAKKFIKKNTGEFDEGFAFYNEEARSEFIFQNEWQADSIARSWLIDAGYAVKGMRQAVQVSSYEHGIIKHRIKLKFTSSGFLQWGDLNSRLIFEVFEDEYGRNVWSVLDSLDRLDKRLKVNFVGRPYLVNRSIFEDCQREARQETLGAFLNNAMYARCVYFAFRFHALDVKNKTYLYYLMEGIRRYCYLMPDLWKKNFATDDFDSAKKSVIGKHIFDIDKYKLLFLEEEDEDLIEAKFYWDGSPPKFKTYLEAFDYFSRIGRKLKEPECILTEALCLHTHKELMYPLLEEYLAHKDIQNRAYAESLLAETPFTKEGQALTVLTKLEPIVRQGEERIICRDQSSEGYDFLEKMLKKTLQGNRKPLYLPKLMENNSIDYCILKELEIFAFLNTKFTSASAELHILDYRYWDFMKKRNLNTIEFINVDFLEVRKHAISLESYESVINKGFKQLLLDTNRDGYVEFSINTLREKKQGFRKFMFLEKKEKLAFKQTAEEQISSLLQTYLHQKDALIKKSDSKFK